MYKKIAQHPGTRRLYADKLSAQGLGATLGDDMAKAYRAAMDAGKHTVDPVLTNFKSKYAVDWSPFLGKKWTDAGDTAIPLAEWKRLADTYYQAARQHHGPSLWSRRCWTTVLPWAVARPMWTGAWANTWRLPRWWPVAIPCVCRVKTAGAVPSPTAMRSCMTRTVRSGTWAPMCRCKTPPTTRPSLWSSTPSCRKKPCWPTNTATRPTIPTHW